MHLQICVTCGIYHTCLHRRCVLMCVDVFGCVLSFRPPSCVGRAFVSMDYTRSRIGTSQVPNMSETWPGGSNVFLGIAKHYTMLHVLYFFYLLVVVFLNVSVNLLFLLIWFSFFCLEVFFTEKVN